MLRLPGRLAQALLMLAAALMVVCVVGAAALAWRLSQGPLDIDWAARQMEAVRNTADSPVRLAIGHAAIRWSGFAKGVGQGLELRLENVRVTDRRGGEVASARVFDLSVSMARLLLGQAVPRVVSVVGLQLRLLRDRAGGVALDLGGIEIAGDDDPAAPVGSLVETMAELARPPRRPGSPRQPGVQHIEQLRTLRITDSTLVLQDPALGGTWRLDVAQLDLQRQRAGGVRGAATATLGLGPAKATVALHADLAPDGGTQVQWALLPVNAGALRRAAPDQLSDFWLDTAVQGLGTLHLNPALLPTAATLRLEAGAGQAHVVGTPIGFDSVAFSADAAWDQPGWHLPDHLSLSHGKLVMRAPGGAWPTVATLGAQMDLAAAGITGTVDATMDHLAFADIGSLWPPPLGGHVRPWLIPNVTSGTARDGAIRLGFHVPPDLSAVVLTAATGSLRGEDVTIHWLSPVPPVEQAQAVLTIKTPDALDIAVTSARQGPTPLKDGLIHITGLSEKDQFLALDADAAGNVADLLTLLRHPALALLSRKPIPMRNPAGTFAGHLTVHLPLNDDLAFSDIKIKATAHTANLRLGGLVAGRDLEHGVVQVDATNDALQATGTAVVAGIPADITVGMDFRDGPASQIVQRAQAVAHATPRQLAAAGWFDPGTLMSGGAGLFTAKFSQRRDNAAELAVSADLSGAGLSLAGWTKPPGPLAEASLRLRLRGDRMLGIDQLHAQGPDMAIDGHVDMVGSEPLLLVLDRIELGPTRAHGQVRFPDQPAQPIRVTLSGAVLDLAPQMAQAAHGSSPPHPPVVSDLRFDRVQFAPGHGLSGVVAHIEHDGKRLTALTVTSTAPERVDLSLRTAAGHRRLTLTADDGGGLLQAVDLLDTVRGGTLKLEATFDDQVPDAPLTGRAELSNFNVRNARLLGKLLQAITIYGLVNALDGPGVVFSDLVLPFRWDGTILEITDMRAFSASLGLTAKGRVDAQHKTLDIQGTLVPAYMINAILGRLPLIGRLFSAERGGGLVAFNYSMSGPAADPSVTVNPLSALTPGFLRGLFHIFD